VKIIALVGDISSILSELTLMVTSIFQVKLSAMQEKLATTTASLPKCS